MKKNCLLVVTILTVLFAFLHTQEIEEIEVTPETAGNQEAPQVTASDDCFTIAWEDYRAGVSNANIYGKTVYPDGTDGSNLIICIAAASNQTDPAVIYNSIDDEFTTLWYDLRTGNQLYGRNSNCTGTAGSEWFIDGITSTLSSPELAFSGTNYLYTWMALNGSNYETKYLVLDGTGSAVGAVQTLSDTSSLRPDVAFDGFEFLVVWEDSTIDGKGIYGGYFDTSGTPIGSAFLLVDDTLASAPAVCGIESAVEDEAKFAIAWQHYDVTTNADIYAGVLDHLSTTAISGAAICTENEGQAEPDIGYHGYGFIVVWKDSRPVFNTDIYGRFLGETGNPLGSDFAICDSANSQLEPKLAYNSAENKYFCVWTDWRNGSNSDIYGALINPPGLITLVSELTGIRNGSKVEVSGDYAFIPCRYGGSETKIVGIDVSDSANPTVIAETQIPDGPYGMGLEIIDTVVCLSTSDSKLHTFHFKDNDTLVLLGSTDIPGGGFEVVGSDTLIYVAATDSISSINIADPENPTRIGGFNPSYNVQGLCLQDTMLFSTEANIFGGSMLRILKVTNPVSIPQIGSQNLPGYGKDVDGDYTTGYMFAADGVRNATTTGVLFSIDVDPPSWPGPDTADVFEIVDGATISAVSVSGELAFVANDSMYVRVIDISDPTNMSEILHIDTDFDALDVFAYGRFLYVLTDSALRIYRINNDVPRVEIISWAFYDSSDGNGIFEPGETLSLEVIVKNTGTDICLGVWLKDELLSGDCSLLEPDSFWIGDMSPGEACTVYFPVKIDNAASTPSQIRINILAYSSNDGNPTATATANIEEFEAILEISSWAFFDSSDADGYFEPGETLALEIIVQSAGNDTIRSAWIEEILLLGEASLLAPDSLWIGDMNPGVIDTSYFWVKINDDASAPSEIEVKIQAHSTNDGNPIDTATAQIESNAVLEILSWAFYDSSDTDGHFEPGESLTLEVIIQNTGFTAVHDAWIEELLVSGDATLLAPDSFWLGDFEDGEVDTFYFMIEIDDAAVAPSQIEIWILGHSTNDGNPIDTAIADIESNAVIEISSWAFFDSSDADGYFEPGETLALEVIIQNTGFTAVHDAWIGDFLLSGDATLLDPDSFWLGDFEDGEVDTFYFMIEINDEATAPSQIEIWIHAHSTNDGNPVETAIADVESNPEIIFNTWAFFDSSDSDGYFEPGETLALMVVVENIGFTTVLDTWIEESLISGEAVLLDPDSIWIGDITQGFVETTFFYIDIDDAATTPSQIDIQLRGYSSNNGNPFDTASAPIESDAELDISVWAFHDSSDADGHYEPGETLALMVVVENIGLSTVFNAWIEDSIISGDAALFGDDSFWLGDIAQGDAETTFFFIDIDDIAVTPSEIEVQLKAYSTNGGSPVDTAIASIESNPLLEISAWAFFDSSDGDGNFEPGETLSLRIIVENTGFSTVLDVWIEDSLVSGDAALFGEDSFWLGDIAQGDVETTFFFIDINDAAATPSEIEVQLMAHSSNDGNPLDTAKATITGEGGFWDNVEYGTGAWAATSHWYISTWDASSPTHAWYVGYEEYPLYGANWVDTLTSQWILLSEDDCRIVVHHRYNTEENYDDCHIDIGTASNWYSMADFDGTSNGWERWAYTFGSLGAGDSFKVRFRFVADNGVQMNGWWLDDIYAGPARIADLWGPRCNPGVALESDSIVFSIYYQRDDGAYPSSAKVFMGDSILDLSTSDGDPSDGAFYDEKICLPAGNYSHHYEFAVPEGTVRFPQTGEIEGPYVNDTAIVIWDFETDNHATDDGCWEYGEPTSGSGAAHSGDNLWATVLDGDYPNNNGSMLVFDELDLTQFEHPHLRLWLWYEMEAKSSRMWCRDGAVARIIIDEDTLFLNQIFEYPRGTNGPPYPVQAVPAWADNDAGNFWHPVQFDLTPWTGEIIKIAINFGSNSNNYESGIYIDDLMLLAEYVEPIVLSFNINGGDSAFIEYEINSRGEYVLSTVDDSIAVVNIGNQALDIGLSITTWDSTIFTPANSNCYGCFWTWAQFTNSLPQPDSASFDSDNNSVYPDSIVYADTIKYGEGGYNLLPTSRDLLWFMLRTPEYFHTDSLGILIHLKGKQHTE